MFRIAHKRSYVALIWMVLICVHWRLASATRRQQPAVQQPAVQQPAILTTGFAGLDHYRASRIAVFTDDYGQLARYRDANAGLKAAGAGREPRSVLRRLHHRYLEAGGLFSRQALPQPRHWRPDNATDAGPFPAGCD